MDPYDWSRFEIFFYIQKPPDDVFKRWATSGGLESFFIRNARHRSSEGRVRDANELARSGDRYEWNWWHAFESSGEIRTVEDQGRRLSFTFGKTCLVEVAVSQAEGSTLVHLVQSRIPVDEDSKVNTHLDCRGGWIYFLTNLKAVLEQGIDVREKDPRRARSLSVRFDPGAP